MSSKQSPRPRKHRQKDDVKQDIVAQVHKPLKNDVVASEESKSDEISESNRTYNIEDKNNDKNSNYSQRTPSRDISIDGESTINTKIISLIETEMKRDINKLNHFSDSRPQSLSFYEDEKMPEELSGNLEMLSPEEKKHYRKRKEYTDIDLERNMYNSMQDIMICRDNDEIINSLKKSKSRKKKHNTTDQETGLGDSREMMIPKEKRKTKKKKREFSPMSTSSGKRKHRKREEDFEPKTEITLALEELQDDVFEHLPEDLPKLDKVRKSPKKSDKIYVQKKNKFEPTLRTELNPNKQLEDPKRPNSYLLPLNIAICYQEKWLPFTMLCHGFLGGIALAHYCYLSVTEEPENKDVLETYAYYSDVYACLFSLLVVICLVSVFDRYDISNLSCCRLKDYIFERKSSVVILIYLVCFVVHLVAIKIDDKISFILHNNTTIEEITHQEIHLWKHLSFWRAILASSAWLIIALAPVKDSFCLHLKDIERYFVTGN